MKLKRNWTFKFAIQSQDQKKRVEKRLDTKTAPKKAKNSNLASGNRFTQGGNRFPVLIFENWRKTESGNRFTQSGN